MKSIFAVLAAVAVTSLAFYAVSSRNATALRKAHEAQLAHWQQTEADLRDALGRARRPIQLQAATGEPQVQVVSAQLSPQEVLNLLTKLRANSRDASIRPVIFRLEQLREIGAPSLPVIAAFLERFEDIDYMGVREEEQERGRGPAGDERGGRRGDFRRRFDVRLSFATPPSLRMGLFDVVQGIGGEEAEKILASTLETTGRAVEVAYLAKVLNELAPAKYNTLAATVAKDLLLNPSPSGGDRLDENAKDYLYYVLAKSGDTSFAATAQSLVVTPDGRIDRHALSYLNETLKEQAMPAIYAAFNDQRITNQWEKASLMQLALRYAGPNQQANEMLNSIISDESVNSRTRTMALVELTRGELTPETIQARLPVVEALKGSTQDQRVHRGLDATYQNLQNLLAGKPVDDSLWRNAMFGRDGERGPARPRDGATGAPGGERTPRQGR